MKIKNIAWSFFFVFTSFIAYGEANLKHSYTEDGVIFSFYTDKNDLVLIEHKNGNYFVSEAIYNKGLKSVTHSYQLPWKPTHVDFFKDTNVTVISSSKKNSHKGVSNEILFVKNGKVTKKINNAFGFTMSRDNLHAVTFEGKLSGNEFLLSFYDSKGKLVKQKLFNQSIRDTMGEYAIAPDLSAFTINLGSRDIGGMYKQVIYFGDSFEEELIIDFGGGDNLIYHVEPLSVNEYYVHASFKNRDKIFKFEKNKIVWEYELPFIKWINQLGLSSDFKYVIVASNPGSFAVLDARTGLHIIEHQLENLHLERSLNFLPSTRESLEFYIRKDKLFINEKNNNRLHTYSLKTNKLLKSVELPDSNHKHNIRQISYDGKQLKTFKPGGELHILDISN
jgi:hypothetical protein